MKMPPRRTTRRQRGNRADGIIRADAALLRREARPYPGVPDRHLHSPILLRGATGRGLMREDHQLDQAHMMNRVQYTGTNYDEVKALCGDKLLSPYFCMGFTMLSLMTEEGFVTVHEGDSVVQDEDGHFSVSKD